jgi:hypothetical protein
MVWPVCKSQQRSVWSSDADTARAPSGVTAIARIGPEWPVSRRTAGCGLPGRLTATVGLGMGAEESDGTLVGVAGGETIFCAGELDFAAEVLNGGARWTSAAGLNHRKMKYPANPIIAAAAIPRIKRKAGDADLCEVWTEALDSNGTACVSRAAVVAFAPDAGDATGLLMATAAANCWASSTEDDNSSERPRFKTAFPSVVNTAIGV